jgi:hypothetical protein
MRLVQESILVTTDASGAATGFSSGNYNGLLVAIGYIPGTDDPLDAGADFAVRQYEDAENVSSSARIWYPRAIASDYLGQELNHPLSSTHLWPIPVALANEPVGFYVENGGDTKTGVFTMVIATDVEFLEF